MIKSEFENLCFNEKGNQQKKKDLIKAMGKIYHFIVYAEGTQLKHFDVTNWTGKVLKERKVFKTES